MNTPDIELVLRSVEVRLNFAAARTGDAPESAKALRCSLSASVQGLRVCRMRLAPA
jgi:hypothetical protein